LYAKPFFTRCPASSQQTIRKAIAKEAIRILHQPFLDKTSAQIQYGISQNLVPIDKRVLWMNYDDIFTELKREFKDTGWTEFTFKKLREEIQKKVDALKLLLVAEISLEDGQDG